MPIYTLAMPSKSKLKRAGAQTSAAAMMSRIEMVPITSVSRQTSQRTLHVHINIPDVDDPRRVNQSSIPWHAIFALIIPAQLVILQVHFQGSSPLHTHPANMWTFMFSLFIYAFALEYYLKLQISTRPDANYQDVCGKIALISGSLASAALISVLVSRSLQLVVFIICFILLSIYFVRNKIIRICKDVVFHAYNKWRQITRRSN